MQTNVSSKTFTTQYSCDICKKHAHSPLAGDMLNPQDEMSERTNNYCLEQASLEHTQSSVLIIGTPAVAYALFNQYPHRQVGDFWYNTAALVPKQVFELNKYNF